VKAWGCSGGGRKAARVGLEKDWRAGGKRKY